MLVCGITPDSGEKGRSSVIGWSWSISSGSRGSGWPSTNYFCTPCWGRWTAQTRCLTPKDRRKILAWW